jgi:hypothetical protein
VQLEILLPQPFDLLPLLARRQIGPQPSSGRETRPGSSFCDRFRLLDSTPVPCAASRETVPRSALAGYGGYGYCGSHSRWFWGFRVYLLCAPDGLPVGFELAPANALERLVAAELLERVLRNGQIVIGDKGFAGREFEAQVAALGGLFLRPDRKDEPLRFGSLGGIRQ